MVFGMSASLNHLDRTRKRTQNARSTQSGLLGICTQRLDGRIEHSRPFKVLFGKTGAYFRFFAEFSVAMSVSKRAMIAIIFAI